MKHRSKDFVIKKLCRKLRMLTLRSESAKRSRKWAIVSFTILTMTLKKQRVSLKRGRRRIRILGSSVVVRPKSSRKDIREWSNRSRRALNPCTLAKLRV